MRILSWPWLIVLGHLRSWELLKLGTQEEPWIVLHGRFLLWFEHGSVNNGEKAAGLGDPGSSLTDLNSKLTELLH
jgi:hypothetical protein